MQAGDGQAFWSKVEKTEGCWLWRGARVSAGYGAHYSSGKNSPAHRHAYELAIGPIPEGLVLDHLCRNPSCVNPAHLEPVTYRENTLRSPLLKAKTHCHRGHPFDEANTYLDKSQLRVHRQCRTCRRLDPLVRERRAQRKAVAQCH